MYQVTYREDKQNHIVNVNTIEDAVSEVFKWKKGTPTDHDEDGWEEIRVSKWSQEREMYLSIFWAFKDDEVLNRKDDLLLYLQMSEQIEEWEYNNRRYPELDPSRLVDFTRLFPCYYDAPQIHIEAPQEIPLDRIYGDNWAFEPRKTRGNYPRHAKLMNLISGYTKVENQGWGEIGSTIPPVPLYYIGGGYFLSEGNHRLYLSTLLNRPTLLAEVVEVDYETFLKDSYLDNASFQQPVIIHNGRVHNVEEEEANNYRIVKDYFRQGNRLDIKDLLTLTRR